MFNKYPYTDNNQLNLDWFLEKFKELYDAWVQFKAETEQEIDDFETAMRNDFNDLLTQFEDFKTFVTTYLDNLDYAGMVADKIEEMVDNGSFLNLMRPAISSEVTTWLSDHIEPTTPPVDDTLTIAGAAADSKIVGDRFAYDESEFNDYFDDIATHGINMFNPHKATLNMRLSNNGNEEIASGFYVSNWIKVNEDFTYYVHVGLQSSTYFTTCFYDSSKAFISGDYQTVTTRKEITTPLGCAYIRIVGTISAIDNQCFSYTLTSVTYKKVLNGLNANYPCFQNVSIFFDRATGELKTLDNTINVITSETLFNFTKPVYIGTNANYVYWDSDDNKIIGSTTLLHDSHKYFLGSVKQATSGLVDTFCGLAHIQSAFPIFTFDSINNKLTIKVETSTYIIYKNQFISLTSAFMQELTLPTNCVVVFDMFSKQFETISSFELIGEKPIVAYRYYREFYTNADYKTPLNTLPYARIACFGDSLTWYDGKSFTWGEHEGETCIGFESYMLNQLNLRQIDNGGYSGAPTPTICANMRSIGASNYLNWSIVTIMGGDNDDRLDTPIGTLLPVGSTFNTSTIIGALQSAIEHVQTCNPACQIVIMTEPMGWTYNDGSFVRVNELIPEAYIKVAKFYGLPVIDLYHESGINEFNRNVYMADPPASQQNLYIYHPNNEGWKRISKFIVNAFKNIIG